MKSLNGTEYKIRHKNGTETNVLTNTAPIFDNGKIVGVRGAAIDINELKKIEKQLKKSEEKYRHVFEKNFTAIIISNIDGKILDCNDAFCKINRIA